MVKDRSDKLIKPESILSFYVDESSGMVGMSMIN